MSTFRTLSTMLVTTLALLLSSASAPSSDQRDEQTGDDHSWTKALEDRAARGTLEDQLQNIRGDTGKWSDEPRLQHAPPVSRKPERLPLDEWGDRLLEEEFQLTSDDDNWLLFRTVQLDDNDRVWVERVERRGNSFTVIANQAIWQGSYRKNFTYHALLGINLGKLDPGQYKATLILKLLEFNRFEDPGTPRDNWPKDEHSAGAEPVELSVTFRVIAQDAARRE